MCGPADYYNAQVRYIWKRLEIYIYEIIQEFLLPWRSLICWRCCSWTAEGIIAAWEGVCGGPECKGNDCRRRRRRAGLRLYFTFACVKSSLNTCVTLTFSLADDSTKPFSQSTVTTDSVVAVSTCGGYCNLRLSFHK